MVQLTHDAIFSYLVSLAQQSCSFIIKIVLCILFWIIGRWIIKKLVNSLFKYMTKKSLDETINKYLRSISSITLEILLIIGIMSFIGIQTTTFTAIIAAGGLAIGMAWSGLLSNFAAGAFIMWLKPFRNGDWVTIGDVSGEVKEIGIFSTAIDTADNIRTLVGNNQIFTQTIKNYSTNKVRRIDISIKVKNDTNINELALRLKDRISKIEGISPDHPIDVEIDSFSTTGPVVVVRPYAETPVFWSCYYKVTAIIKEECKDALNVYPLPKDLI